MPRFGRVVLGGTFDHLHVGHEALLATALREGRRVAIGLTTEGYLARHPKPGGVTIAPEASRRRTLERWLGARYPRRRWVVVPLEDRFGRSAEDGVDALVVSADTVAGGRAVNRERQRLGRPTIPLLVVPLVLADDLEPVSARRIRTGEIDRKGRRLSPIAVGVTVADRDDATAAARALRSTFPHARLRPRDGRAARGGRAAVRRLAARAQRGADLGVAVVRRRDGGWLAALRGRHVALDPQPIPGDSPSDLVRGLAQLLRPARAKPLFGSTGVRRSWRRTSG